MCVHIRGQAGNVRITQSEISFSKMESGKVTTKIVNFISEREHFMPHFKRSSVPNESMAAIYL